MYTDIDIYYTFVQNSTEVRKFLGKEGTAEETSNDVLFLDATLSKAIRKATLIRLPYIGQESSREQFRPLKCKTAFISHVKI